MPNAQSLLRQRLVVLCPIMFLTLWLVKYARYIAGGEPPTQDYAGHLIGGRTVLEGLPQLLYDIPHQITVQHQLIGTGTNYGLNAFASPPFVAYLFAPFAA